MKTTRVKILTSIFLVVAVSVAVGLAGATEAPTDPVCTALSDSTEHHVKMAARHAILYTSSLDYTAADATQAAVAYGNSVALAVANLAIGRDHGCPARRSPLDPGFYSAAASKCATDMLYAKSGRTVPTVPGSPFPLSCVVSGWSPSAAPNPF